jgi:oligopeptidase B
MQTAHHRSSPCGAGQNLDADFHAERLALFTRGWVYAMCHVRGGLERGKAWHEDGRLMRKVCSRR